MLSKNLVKKGKRLRGIYLWEVREKYKKVLKKTSTMTPRETPGNRDKSFECFFKTLMASLKLT